MTHAQNEDDPVECHMPDLSSWNLSDMATASETLKEKMEVVLEQADDTASTIPGHECNFEHEAGDDQLP